MQLLVKTCILFLTSTVTSIVFQRKRELSVKWKDAPPVQIKISHPQRNGMSFWWIKKNKLHIVNLLVEYIKLEAVANKAVILNQNSHCFFVNQTSICVCIPELDSPNRAADEVYAGQDSSNKVWVIADNTDTDIYYKSDQYSPSCKILFLLSTR